MRRSGVEPATSRSHVQRPTTNPLYYQATHMMIVDVMMMRMMMIMMTTIIILNFRISESFLAHSKNELMQWRGVRRLSVRLSVRL